MPKEYKEFLDAKGIEYIETTSLDEYLNDCDILYMTRVQQERFTDPMEYERVKDVYTLSASMQKRYAGIIIKENEQDHNDQTKAVKHLMERGYTNIAIIGDTGKREDHTLGNIALLVEYMRAGASVRMYTDYGVFIPCKNSRTFASYAEQAVSVFNISAKGLRSNGLQYPIYDFTSLWQGTLNRAEGAEFTIEADGEYILFMAY